MAERYYRVDIQFRSGASESFDAQAFDIDVSNIGELPRTSPLGSYVSGGYDW
jgi:hypothetical protein